MGIIDRLLKDKFPPQKNKKPLFHKTIPYLDKPNYDYTSVILSGETPGWFKLDDEPISTKMWISPPDVVIELSGRYVEYGVGFAVELKEEHSWIPLEWIGLRVRFV